MATPVRVLFVEDPSADISTIVDQLRMGGYEPETRRVDTRSGLRDALFQGKWDIIVSNDELERLDGLSALALVKESGRDIPFIMVSGTVGEQKAVGIMKAGAGDLITKDNMARLVPAVSRALREAEARRGRTKAERALRRREEELRLALAAARMGTWDWDLTTRRMSWSEHAEGILGVAPGGVPRTRDAYLSLVHPDDRRLVENALTAAREQGRDYALAHRIRTAGGPVRWIGIKGRRYGGDGEGPERMSGTVADITDRKEAEAALTASERKYRELYEEAPVALYSVNPDGDIIRANRRACEVFGYSMEELVGRSAELLAAPTAAGRQRLADLAERIVSGVGLTDEVVELQRPDGSVWWGSLSLKPVLTDDGQLAVSRATLIDITVRRRAEELLQLSQRAIDGSPDFIVICDADYVYRRVNKAHARAHGRSQDQLVGARIPDVIGRKVFEEVVKPRYDECLAGEEVSYEVWHTFPAIGRRFIALTYSPLRSAQGAVEGVILIGRDATERKRSEEARDELEAQLRQAQKMESLGTLAGGIAHDFNNLLLAILGYGELTRDELPPDSPLRANIDQILSAGERAQALVKQILAFGRRSDRASRPLELHAAVKEAVSFLRATLPATIEIVVELDQSPCVVLADAAQLHQVLLNLASNALHAMRVDGGKLGIAAAPVLLGADEGERLGVPAGEYVLLSVTDTGAGMDPAVLERIYDPFFTTKGPGEGTGLGLSVVHGIVMSHGGALRATSTVGEGTRIDVYLPRTSRMPVTDADDMPEAGGTERVLFVDDEEPLAILGGEVLERLGYRVQVETGGPSALRAFREAPDAFDLVVTDQTMPGCTGLQLARDIRDLRPHVPVVLTTGFSEAVTPDALAAESIAAVVMKPYVTTQLARAVREALDGVREVATQGR